MLTTKNYFEKTANLDFQSVPEALQKGHDLVKQASQNNWEPYLTSESIKRVVDIYFTKMDAYLSSMQTTTPKPKRISKEKTPQKRIVTPQKKETPAQHYKGKQVEIRPLSKRSKKLILWDIQSNQKFSNETFNTQSEAKKFINDNGMIHAIPTKTTSKTKLVEKITSDIQFIRRYIAMNGKVKTEAQILGLLTSLQRAILEKRITKQSPNASIINTMQEQLIYLYENMKNQIMVKIEPSNLERYKAIADSEKGLTSISLLKSYVSLHGKTGVIEKAKKLVKRMEDAVRQERISCADPYKSEINTAHQRLLDYIKKKTKTIEITEAELHGLGCAKENLGTAKQHKVISSSDLAKMEFETIGLKGKYKDLLGDPSVGFLAMVYGLPKSGKSTFCIQLANYLAKNHGNVLYCAIEEGFGYTLKEKITRLNAVHPRLHVSDIVDADIKPYDFIFIDSVSKAQIDVKDITALKKKHPRKSFIFIYHTTKQGNFKGGNEHAHEVDVIVKIENGIAIASGRFGVGGEIGI